MAHLGIVHRHRLVLAHSLFQAHLADTVSVGITGGRVSAAALHILEQQLSQQFRRDDFRLTLPAASRQPLLGLLGQLEQLVDIGHNLH